MKDKYPLVNAVAPIRICDIGGWTDTWFAKFGQVFSIAVYPYIEVQLQLFDREDNNSRVEINVENYDQTYTYSKPIKCKGSFGETLSLRLDEENSGKHPLIEAAIDEMEIPRHTGVRANIFSNAPPGASTGTSAAVSVALIGALDRLTEGTMSPYEVAKMAHNLETINLHLECGVQDQLASAYGGINHMFMTAYPSTTVSPIYISDSIWWELEERLVVIYIGTPHSSSDIHKEVIKTLQLPVSMDTRLSKLRDLPQRAKNALYVGDFVEFGKVMDENTNVQRDLHPGLVCEDFEKIIAISREYGALGCKVNGAGGDGGSVTILFGSDRARKREMIKELVGEGFQHIPVYLARKGLRVW